MGPGPSEVDPRVYRAMIQPVIGHVDPLFLEVINQLQQMLRHTFRTRNPITLPIPGTGSVAHLEENVAAAAIELTDADFAALDQAARKAA